MTQIEIPARAVKLWFWMLEDSGEPKLEAQSERALLSLFKDLDAAREFLKQHPVQ
ncbi:hypothetical protein [Planctobacterium marinum]|uniref:Uncharacterized protein n=1 Tax=Planctobacterium marinum TaxID=1631968 RepID=A0AA48HT20_9ALTE|nr:hypothetical protein MACH26_08290 [Planctobacterium marinum]